MSRDRSCIEQIEFGVFLGIGDNVIGKFRERGERDILSPTDGNRSRNCVNAQIAEIFVRRRWICSDAFFRESRSKTFALSRGVD